MHFVFAPSDWRIRDAVLADISRSGFPLLYDYNGVEYLLRAPLGMYMLPGLVGKAFGLAAAHAALWAQNSLFLGSIFYVVAQIGRGWMHVFVMLMFAGCTLLGVWIYYSLSHKTQLDHMLRYGMDAWNPYFQYSGSLVQLFWVPNHALPAWWLAMLIVLQAKKQVDAAAVAATVGGAMFWSPLVVLPAFLWVALRAFVDWRHVLSSRRIWLVALVAPCFLPVALYMVVGASSIAHGVAATKPMFAIIYLVFMVAQLIHVAYIFAYRATAPRYLAGPVLFSVCMLAALPMFDFGPANDLVMRGSITLLVLVAFAFGAILLAPENRWRRPFWIGLALIVACAPSPLFELARPFTHMRYDISDCSLFEASVGMDSGVPTNYVVERASVPNWLVDLATAPHRRTATRDCWSDGGDPDKQLSPQQLQH